MKIKKNTLLLASILLLMTRCAYILPAYFFRSAFSCENIAALICIVWFIAELPIISRQKGIVCFTILALLMALCSSIQASLLYSGQSILDGIMCQKIFISGIFLVSVIYKLVNKGRMTLEEIERILKFCAIFHIVVYFLQFLVGPDRMFLSCHYTTPSMDARVNRIRLYGGTQYIVFAYILALANIGRKKKWNNCFIGLFIAYALIVNQGRAFIIQAFALLLFSLLFYKGSGTKRVVFLTTGVILISFILSSDFFSNLISTFITTTTSSHGTLAVRYRAQKFYIEFLRQHPLLGGGYADIQNANAYILSGYASGFLVGDNGVFGLVFRYGMVGLIWLVCCMINFVKNGIKLLRQYQDPFLLLEALTILIGFMTSVAAFDGIGVFYSGLYVIFGITKLSQYSRMRGDK